MNIVQAGLSRGHSTRGPCKAATGAARQTVPSLTNQTEDQQAKEVRTKQLGKRGWRSVLNIKISLITFLSLMTCLMSIEWKMCYAKIFESNICPLSITWQWYVVSCLTWVTSIFCLSNLKIKMQNMKNQTKCANHDSYSVFFGILIQTYGLVLKPSHCEPGDMGFIPAACTRVLKIWAGVLCQSVYWSMLLYCRALQPLLNFISGKVTLT